MRTFLPIKGPGGRMLTPREKAALFVLAVTLVVSLLTLLLGASAFVPSPSRNPVLAAVSVPSRVVGGGAIAFYALVIVWSALVYWKGERAANLGSLSGRVFAGFCAAMGISGALGVARFDAAGDLGTLVGSAVHDTLGPPVGFGLLLLLVLLGLSLAAQGYWTALRGSAAAAGDAPYRPYRLVRDESLWGSVARRRSGDAPLPGDGDPTPEDRTLAVTQAMEEIERSQGVTILEVDLRCDPPAREDVEAPEEEGPRSIGEEVAEAPPPPAGSEEAEVRRGLEQVQATLDLDAGAGRPRDAEPPSAEDALVEPQARAPDSADPFERPGILDRVSPEERAPREGPERPYTSFDWRGRPLD